MTRENRRSDYEYWLPGVLIAVLFAIGCFQIFSRFIFSYPLTWGEEAMRLSFLLLVFFGAFAVTLNRAHLLVDLMAMYVRPRVSAPAWRAYEAVVLVLQAGFFALCAYGSFQMAAVRWNIVSQTMPFWRIGFMYVLTGSALLACSFASLYLIFKNDEQGGS